MSTEAAKNSQSRGLPAELEQVLVQGNLQGLNPDQRLQYYRSVCDSLGLNPLTKPFEYITLNGKLVLYAKRDACDQLRKIHGISITITSSKVTNGIMNVIASATDKTGRVDEELGSVSLGNAKGDQLANLQMKCVTKAKRRVTLSICGLGMLDETEVETINVEPTASQSQEPSAKSENPKPQMATLNQVSRINSFPNQGALHEYLHDKYDVGHCSELTKQQASEVISAHDKKYGGKKYPHRNAAGPLAVTRDDVK